MLDDYLVMEQKFMENHETDKVFMDGSKQIKGLFSSKDEAEVFIKDTFGPFSAVIQQENQKYFSTGWGEERKFYTIREGSTVYFPIIQLF